jgi:thiamine-phosphate pyrophosphorylase
MADGCLLYYITDRTAFAPDEPTRRHCLMEKIAEAARAGVDYIQLREKDLSTRELESLAHEAVGVLNQLRTEKRELKTALLINSRTDIAIATDADGVHLRSDDICASDVRRLWNSCSGDKQGEPLIGVSCHSLAEVVQAHAGGATFAVFAPVFEKKDIPNTQPVGLTQLREACKVKIPVLALGGVTLENAWSCLDAGASGIAAIRLFQENDIAEIVHELGPRSR